jgi:hypothetical protein
MFLCDCALQRQEKNSDIFVEQTYGVTGIFAKFVPDQFRFTVPREIFVLSLIEGTSDQLHLIIHVCPTASFSDCYLFKPGASVRDYWVINPAHHQGAVRLSAGAD